MLINTVYYYISRLLRYLFYCLCFSADACIRVGFIDKSVPAVEHVKLGEHGTNCMLSIKPLVKSKITFQCFISKGYCRIYI